MLLSILGLHLQEYSEDFSYNKWLWFWFSWLHQIFCSFMTMCIVLSMCILMFLVCQWSWSRALCCDATQRCCCVESLCSICTPAGKSTLWVSILEPAKLKMMLKINLYCLLEKLCFVPWHKLSWTITNIWLQINTFMVEYAKTDTLKPCTLSTPPQHHTSLMVWVILQ